MAAGMTLAEMQESIRFKDYRDWGFYEEWLSLNIQGMYNMFSEQLLGIGVSSIVESVETGMNGCYSSISVERKGLVQHICAQIDEVERFNNRV